MQHAGEMDPLPHARPLQILAHAGHGGPDAHDDGVCPGRFHEAACNRARQKARVLLRGQAPDVADDERVLRNSQDRAKSLAAACGEVLDTHPRGNDMDRHPYAARRRTSATASLGANTASLKLL